MFIEFTKKILNNLKNDPFLNKIIKNSSIILLGDTSSALINLISFALLAKNLGPESLAVIVLIQTYILIINALFNIQTWESMIKFGHGSSSSVLNTVKTNVILDLTSSIMAYIFSLFLISPIIILFEWNSDYIPMMTIYSITILFNLTSLTIGLPRLFNKFATVAKIQIFMAILRLIGIVIITLSSNILIDYIYVFICVDILTNLSLIFYSQLLLKGYADTHWWKAKLTINMNQIRFIWWNNLRTIIRIPVQRLDIIIISMILSLEMVGVYKVYKEVAGIINRLRAPVNVALFPEFTKIIHMKDMNIYQTTKKTITIMSAISIVLTIILLLLSNTIIDVFFGAEYMGQMDIIYLLIVLFGLGFAISPIDSLFTAAGFAKYSFYVVLTTNTIYLIIALILGNTIGLYGIIIAYACHLIFNKGAKIIIMALNPDGWDKTIR